MRTIKIILGGLALLVMAGCLSPTPQATTATAAQPAANAQVEMAAAPATMTTGDRFLYADAPVASGYPNSWTVLENIGYESAYDETFRNPVWVAYHLAPPAHTPPPRPSIGYPTDSRTESKVTAADFPSGYDHGHMAPNEAIATFFSAAAQNETFFMSNMVAQRPGLNRGPWKSLETQEYSNWARGHELWIICGPVYTTAADQPVAPADRYGAKQVCIPVACFKIEMTKDGSGLHTLAFIMPQDVGTGHKPAEFLTSIREIEKRTGLNFFSSLPQAKQDEIEEKIATSLWP